MLNYCTKHIQLLIVTFFISPFAFSSSALETSIPIELSCREYNSGAMTICSSQQRTIVLPMGYKLVATQAVTTIGVTNNAGASQYGATFTIKRSLPYNRPDDAFLYYTDNVFFMPDEDALEETADSSNSKQAEQEFKMTVSLPELIACDQDIVLKEELDIALYNRTLPIVELTPLVADLPAPQIVPYSCPQSI